MIPTECEWCGEELGLFAKGGIHSVNGDNICRGCLAHYHEYKVTIGCMIEEAYLSGQEFLKIWWRYRIKKMAAAVLFTAKELGIMRMFQRYAEKVEFPDIGDGDDRIGDE